MKQPLSDIHIFHRAIVHELMKRVVFPLQNASTFNPTNHYSLPMPPKKKQKKIFVLDTSVILHDHNSVRNFEEHDVVLPIPVLEELDNFKKGNDTKNFEAREFIRMMDRIAGDHNLNEWIPNPDTDGGRIKIVMNYQLKGNDATKVFGDNKADHRILNTALFLQETEGDRKVILVTKDINLRLKAKALNVIAEDYKNDKLKDVETLNKGISIVEHIDHEEIKEIFRQGYTENVQILGDHLENNMFYILKNGKVSTLAFYNCVSKRLERVEKSYTVGIKPKNAEQTFALHAILNPDVKLVAIQGVAGTGKTLLALAGAIEQRKNYRQIILARPIVPLSNRDIGYLPGDANEKIDPYMAPLWDNLDYIKSQFKETEKNFRMIEELKETGKMIITPLAFIRGRSLSNIFFIIDEAQNLTPHEVKTIITRAGENTKLVFTGDINQIDTPYLDQDSNGLSYLIDRLKGNDLFAHVKLEKGERSELANLANDLL
jgi:PhoH-like ATPase